jgi:TorA maturation chaperone TorD
VILIVSANPLLKEILCEATTQIQLEYIELDPGEALSGISVYQPEIIIVDETIERSLLEGILAKARGLQKTRTIVLHPQKNDIILLDSRRATLRKVNDLKAAILARSTNPETELVDCPISENRDAAQALAGMYGFLAAMFNQRPDVDLVMRLRTVGMDAFISLEHEGDGADDISQGIRLMTDFVEKTADLPAEQVEQDLAVDWTRLFRGISPNYGPPPPYEGLYLEGVIDPLNLFQTLIETYAEGGAEIGGDFTNRVDYLGLELGFLSFLTEQEAYALEREDEEAACNFEEKARSFINEHLGLWAWKFSTTALEHAKTDFFKGFLLLARGVFSQISKMASG